MEIVNTNRFNTIVCRMHENCLGYAPMPATFSDKTFYVGFEITYYRFRRIPQSQEKKRTVLQ